ncbi:hypothetical protein [Vreelandella venusta]|uniref:hypothetical protein n=1 Tax=Vreelandella venusta TaxID=44935 RepID=UPI0038505903
MSTSQAPKDKGSAQGWQQWPDKTSRAIKTVEGIVQKGTFSMTGFAQKICKRWPQYCLWLMIDQVNEEAGQISPQIEKARADLKKTGTDTH